YRHRLGWGLNMLKTAGYVESPSQGSWRLTPKGKDLFGSFPSGFDDATTRRIVRESQGTAASEPVVAEESLTAAETGQTPEDLLHALGYGTSLEDLQHLGRSGDGGLDGVISLDKLGLEKVYVQAKRWQGPVGRPEVQAFYGALAGRRAKKGVLITTSNFTREA